MKNHVFLLQVHKTPLLLRRILKRLQGSNHYFCINIDAKVRDVDIFYDNLKDIENIIFISNENIMHGGFSQIACTVHQLKYSYSYKVKFDYFHSISGQDYPIVSNREFDDYFEHSTGSYMLSDTEEEAHERRLGPYRQRLEHWYFMDVFNGPIARRLHISGILNRLLYWIPRPLTFMDRIYGGWNWFSLHRDAVEYLLFFLTQHNEYINRFKYTFCTDEIFYSTILRPVREKFNIYSRNSLRYIDWYPKRNCSSLPLILEETEFEDIMSIGALFCRKVDLPQSSKLLDRIDSCCKD